MTLPFGINPTPSVVPRQGSALDDEAQARATSVYLVQRVIPMLPRLLCEQLCSLNPGQPFTVSSSAYVWPCYISVAYSH